MPVHEISNAHESEMRYNIGQYTLYVLDFYDDGDAGVFIAVDQNGDTCTMACSRGQVAVVHGSHIAEFDYPVYCSYT